MNHEATRLRALDGMGFTRGASGGGSARLMLRDAERYHEEQQRPRGPYKRREAPLLPRVDESWREEAACRGKVDLFFPPERGHRRAQPDHVWHEARAICASCPSLGPCREDVLSTEPAGGRYGFRAGMTPEERGREAARRRGGLA